MTSFVAAVERQNWRLVALYLLLGVAQAAAELPPESLAALLEALEGPQPNARG